jgi:hypothetical protein
MNRVVLATRELIFCVERKFNMSLQSIAGLLGVAEPTVWRWREAEIHPNAGHSSALIALHDLDFCEHTEFEYLCDHPDLDQKSPIYEATSVTDLISISELRTFGTPARAHQIRGTDTPPQIRTIKIIPVHNLPIGTRSRSYVASRFGPPVYLIFVRADADVAAQDQYAYREIHDHVLNRRHSIRTLPTFESTKTVLPKPHNTRRSRKPKPERL